MIRVLFICLGNICRSPAAEGIFTKMVDTEKLTHKLIIDSAGTSHHHAGEPADERMRDHAMERGYDLTSISRGFENPEDFKNFDYLITMDESNYANIVALDRKGEYKHKVFPMVQFCKIHQVKKVPDPYYGGDDGFRLVLDILEDACEGLLKRIRKDHQL